MKTKTFLEEKLKLYIPEGCNFLVENNIRHQEIDIVVTSQRNYWSKRGYLKFATGLHIKKDRWRANLNKCFYPWLKSLHKNWEHYKNTVDITKAEPIIYFSNYGSTEQ